MEYPYDSNALRFRKVKNNMTAGFKSMQTTPKLIAGTSEGGIPGEQIEAVFQFGKIAIRLPKSPICYGVRNDLIEIIFGLD